MSETLGIVESLNREIINPLIVLLFALALTFFLWGIFNFIRQSDSDEAREVGRRHILWGLVGMVVIISVIGILQILANTFGFDLPQGL